MRPDTDFEWEKWAQTQPFFSILTNPIFLIENWEENRDQFWDSGYRQLATKLFVSKVFIPKN